MGQRPDQIEAEIEELRHETDLIVDELTRRANPQNVLQTVAARVTEGAGTLVNEAVAEAPELARRNPLLLNGAAVSGAAALGVYALSTAILGHRSGAAERELDRRPALEDLGEDLDEVVARVVERAKAEQGRVVIRRREPSMLKRVMWIALASGMAALGSMLFRRLTAQFWRSAMQEEPPEK